MLAVAVEYELIGANPAAGRRRRLKGTRPARLSVEPEQLMALLDAAAAEKPLLAGRGRPLLATLAGAGLRIGEALALERRDVNILRGTLTVRASKTEAGVRMVDLTPALRDELATVARPAAGEESDCFRVRDALRAARQPQQRPHPALPSGDRAGERDAHEARALEPIGNVTAHGLRRTYASLRCAVGDDPAYTASQLGHEDPTFTLRVYTHAVKRRDRLSGNEREAFDRAVDWAAIMGSKSGSDGLTVEAALLAKPSNPAAQAISS